MFLRRKLWTESFNIIKYSSFFSRFFFLLASSARPFFLFFFFPLQRRRCRHYCTIHECFKLAIGEYRNKLRPLVRTIKYIKHLQLACVYNKKSLKSEEARFNDELSEISLVKTHISIKISLILSFIGRIIFFPALAFSPPTPPPPPPSPSVKVCDL